MHEMEAPIRDSFPGSTARGAPSSRQPCPRASAGASAPVGPQLARGLTPVRHGTSLPRPPQWATPLTRRARRPGSPWRPVPRLRQPVHGPGRVLLPPGLRDLLSPSGQCGLRTPPARGEEYERTRLAAVRPGPGPGGSALWPSSSLGAEPSAYRHAKDHSSDEQQGGSPGPSHQAGSEV